MARSATEDTRRKWPKSRPVRLGQGLVERLKLSRGGEQAMPLLEGLCGLAVSLVSVVHFATLAQPWLDGAGVVGNVVRAVHSIHPVGVDLFSLVTGMLVYVTLMRRAQPWWACLSRRVRCIHLAFPAAFTVYLVVDAAMPALGKLLDRGLSAYLLTNVLLLSDLLLITPFITVMWSLPYEMFLYLAAPLVVGLCCLRQRPASWRASAPAVLGARLLARAVAAAPPDG